MASILKQSYENCLNVTNDKGDLNYKYTLTI